MTATQAASPRVQGLAPVPVGGGEDWPDHETTHQAKPQQPGPTGVEGAGGICRGAGGRRQGLAKQQANAPSNISDQAPLVWRAPEGSAAVPVGGGGAWPGFEATRRAKLAARTARGRAAAHRHTQRPGPPAPETPVGPQAAPQPQPGKTKTADPEGSAVSSCARGELNPHSITGTRT